LREADHTIAKLKPEEESKWVQWVKVKQVHAGVDGTKYFHLIANNKHSRKKIFWLEEEEGNIIGQDNLKNYIPDENYKCLFAHLLIIMYHILTRVNSTNVLDEGLRIGGIGRRMNSKVKSVKQGVYRN
jgi:hypothetical protein